MGEHGMIELSKRGLLDGQKIANLEFYEHYVFGKHKRGQVQHGDKFHKGDP